MIVGMRLKNIDKKDMLSDIVEALDLQSVMEREVGQLSGGEL
jgi:ATP-binding cassette subfamily E protein 1